MNWPGNAPRIIYFEFSNFSDATLIIAIREMILILNSKSIYF